MKRKLLNLLTKTGRLKVVRHDQEALTVNLLRYSPRLKVITRTLVIQQLKLRLHKGL